MSFSLAAAFSLHLSTTKTQMGSSSFSLFSTTNRKKEINVRRKISPLSLRCEAQQLADLAPAATAAYGALLLSGGLFAFARSGSKGSIFGGLAGASLMAGASYLMQVAETRPAGEAIAFGSAFLFSAVFGIRLAATQKLIPSGILLVISLGALAVFGSAYLQDKI